MWCDHPEDLTPSDEGFRDSEKAYVYDHPVHWDKVATNKELLNFANEVRINGGADALDALIPSYPSDSEACLIAKAVNFESEVNSERIAFDCYDFEEEADINTITNSMATSLGYEEGENVWSMKVTLSNKTIYSKVEAIGKAMNLPYAFNDKEYRAEILLPAKIARAAICFDAYGDCEGPDFSQYKDLVDSTF